MLRINAAIDPGWHLYAASSPAGIPTSFTLAPNAVVARTRLYQSAPKRAFDPNFNSETETFEGAATFGLVIETRPDAPAGNTTLEIAARFQTCNDNTCVPGKWSGTANLTVDPTANVSGMVLSGLAEVKPPRPVARACRLLGILRFQPKLDPVPARRLRLRPGFHLHAVRFPDDSHHHVVLPQPAIRRRRDAILQAVVFCLGIIVLFSGWGC
jgi:hypothetical protein